MPNWCENRLEVSGRKEELSKFRDKIKAVDSQVFPKLLDTFYPMPENIFRGAVGEKEEAKYGKLGCWYGWSIENWGTKWDVDARVMRDKERTLSLQFDSAWSPPENWLMKVSKDYPKLTFIMTYEEEGMDFRGRLKVKNGRIDKIES